VPAGNESAKANLSDKDDSGVANKAGAGVTTRLGEAVSGAGVNSSCIMMLLRLLTPGDGFSGPSTRSASAAISAARSALVATVGFFF
jgi:hypothetical protein